MPNARDTATVPPGSPAEAPPGSPAKVPPKSPGRVPPGSPAKRPPGLTAPVQSRLPVALTLLTGALLLGYGVEWWIALREGPAELESILHDYGLVPREVLAGRVGTLVTAIFLHADPFHLLSNLAFLVTFGVELEPRVGPRRFALVFLGCGLIAGLLHVAMAWDSFVPTVGASGAVSGVLGAWWRLRRREGADAPEVAAGRGAGMGRTPGFVLVGLWVGAQALAAAAGPGSEASWAHLGGFAAGLALAPTLAVVSPRTP